MDDLGKGILKCHAACLTIILDDYAIINEEVQIRNITIFYGKFLVALYLSHGGQAKCVFLFAIAPLTVGCL